MTKTVEIPAEKILMESDPTKINYLKEQARHVLPYLQKVIDDYHLQGVETPLTMEVIQNLVFGAGPSEIIREELAGTEPVKIGNIALARDRVKSMLEVPNLGHLIQSAEALKGALRLFRERYYGGLELFEIRKGKAVLSEKAMKEKEESFNTYAVTDAEKEAWLIIQEIKERMQYLHKTFRLTITGSANPATDILRETHVYQHGHQVRINASKLKSQLKGTQF